LICPIQQIPGNTGTISSIRWSTNDEVIGSASVDGAVYAWDLSNLVRVQDHVDKGLMYSDLVMDWGRRWDRAPRVMPLAIPLPPAAASSTATVGGISSATSNSMLPRPGSSDGPPGNIARSASPASLTPAPGFRPRSSSISVGGSGAAAAAAAAAASATVSASTPTASSSNGPGGTPSLTGSLSVRHRRSRSASGQSISTGANGLPNLQSVIPGAAELPHLAAHQYSGPAGGTADGSGLAEGTPMNVNGDVNGTIIVAGLKVSDGTHMLREVSENCLVRTVAASGDAEFQLARLSVTRMLVCLMLYHL
jgi:hypothetical protein